jgi:hypothetical protein
MRILSSRATYLDLDIRYAVLVQLSELVSVFIQEVAQAELGYLDGMGQIDSGEWHTSGFKHR